MKRSIVIPAHNEELRLGRSSVNRVVAQVRLRRFYFPLRCMIPVIGRLVEKVIRYNE